MPARNTDTIGGINLLYGLVVIALLTVLAWPMVASASGFSPRTLQQASAAPGVSTDYTLSFTVSNSITLGSLSILFCANDPVQSDSCDLPTGIDVTNAQLTAQTGITDFTLFNVASNSFLLSRTPSVITAPLPVTLTFHNIVNPSGPGPYYARIAGYSSTNGTGSSVAYGGLAFDVVNNVQVSSVVPPYLTFCSGVTIPAFDCTTALGDQIDLGGLSAAHSSQAASQLLVATNASDGYTIQVAGTTMTAGNNVITNLTGPTASQPGNAQFGINLRGNSVPAIGSDPTGPGTGQPVGGYALANRFQFDSNDVIAASSASDAYRRYTVSYLVNVPASQPPGVYASTLTYVAAGSF